MPTHERSALVDVALETFDLRTWTGSSNLDGVVLLAKQGRRPTARRAVPFFAVLPVTMAARMTLVEPAM